MEIEKFNQAKFIREQIVYMNDTKSRIAKMPKRDDDEDFNFALQKGFDAICYSISRLEKDFDIL